MALSFFLTLPGKYAKTQKCFIEYKLTDEAQRMERYWLEGDTGGKTGTTVIA